MWIALWAWLTAPRNEGETDPRFWLAVLALAAAHLGLVAYFFGTELPLRWIPFSGGDFATHAAQVKHVLEGLESEGQPWVYDVQLLAGAPNGVLFDADNKAWELWTYLLIKCGVNPGRAYNAFVLFIHLAMPLSLYAAARCFDLDRRSALTATGLGVGLWFFDSFTHWIWFVGAISYVFVAYFCLLPLGLLYRWLERRKLGYALGVALSLAFAHLVHPYVFFILVVPMLALYLRAWKSMSLAEHAIMWGIAGFTVLCNAWWLAIALRFVHYILDSAYYEQSGLRFIAYDLLGLLHDWQTQGMLAPRTGVRLLVVITGIFGLRAWRLRADRRRLPLLSLLLTMVLLSYFGGYTFFEQIQPYRHTLPLAFALLLPAGQALSEGLARRPLRGLSRVQRWSALVLIALSAQLLVRDALYFFAPSMPATQPLQDGRSLPMNGLGHGATLSYRYDDQRDWESLISIIQRRDTGRSRWLIQDSILGEYMMARTDAQILGGFRVRNIEHSDANWFRRHGEPPYDLDALLEYFRTYAVGWIIVHRLGIDPFWDSHPELFTRQQATDEFVVYMVHLPVSLIEGQGEVRARFNRIEVHGSAPDQDLVLRYHWMETLRCEPDCSMEREPVEGDRVGFIRVPAPHPADFAIVNSYEWP